MKRSNRSKRKHWQQRKRLPYDPFGEGRVIYTIKNIIAENPDIVYNDGMTTMILNAKGKGSGNEELEKLLDFFVDTDKEVTDTELLDIQNIVKSIKGDAKVGERYMTLGTTLYYEKKMSYDEGIQIGKEQGIIPIKKCNHKLEL